MYQLRKVQPWNIPGIFRVVGILSRCGKNMAQKYDLHHWDNPFIKNLAIVALCILKNKLWLVYDRTQAVATFQTKKTARGMHLQKLGTDPACGGKGIGSFCMRTIERMAKEASCDTVYFEVYDKSQHALDFYLHRGYTVCGQVSTLKYTELTMEKKLGEEL